MKESELKIGSVFEFDNSKWCEEAQSDDMRGGFIAWNKRTGNFLIMFNEKCIHTSKTLKSAEKRLQSLFFKWNLQFITN